MQYLPQVWTFQSTLQDPDGRALSEETKAAKTTGHATKVTTRDTVIIQPTGTIGPLRSPRKFYIKGENDRTIFGP